MKREQRMIKHFHLGVECLLRGYYCGSVLPYRLAASEKQQVVLCNHSRFFFLSFLLCRMVDSDAVIVIFLTINELFIQRSHEEKNDIKDGADNT